MLSFITIAPLARYLPEMQCHQIQGIAQKKKWKKIYRNVNNAYVGDDSITISPYSDGHTLLKERLVIQNGKKLLKN